MSTWRVNNVRKRAFASVTVLIGFVLMMSCQALAAASDDVTATAGSSPQNAIDRANSSIDRAIEQAQTLADKTPRDDQTIADKLVAKTDRIAERTERKLGAGSVEQYLITVQVGDAFVEVDPMKVAGE